MAEDFLPFTASSNKIKKKLQKPCNLSSSAYLVAKYIATFEILRISFQKMEKKHENFVISRDFFVIFHNRNQISQIFLGHHL
jgi:hypothetical protein